MQTGTQRQKHPGLIADDGLRRTPPRDRLAADLDDAGEILAIDTSRAHNRPTVPVEQEDTVKPMPRDLDQIPHIGVPDLMGSRGVLGTFIRIRWAMVWRRGGMGLFIEGHHLPDARVAIPIPERIQGHLRAIMPQQRIVVQELEDLHDHLDWHPGADRRVLPRAGVQSQEPFRLEAALPAVDHMRINRQQGGKPAGSEADL